LLLASLLALCNGAMVGHIMSGHTQFVAAASFPLTLALVLEAFDPSLDPARRSFRACLAGAMLAAAYYSGAAHPLFYFVLGFVVLAPLFTVLLSPRRYRVVLSAAALVGVTFVALAAFKLLPGLVDFAAYHVNYRGTYRGWLDFTRNFVIPWSPSPDDYPHETNLYVGWVGVGLLAFAIAGLRDRRHIPLLLACGALACLMCWRGDGQPFTLPVLRTQGAFQRARIVLLPALAVVAMSQLQRTLAWMRRSPRRRLRLGTLAVVAGLAVFLAFDLSRTNVRRHVTLRARDEVPHPVEPFDTAPELTPVDKRAHVKVGRVRASDFDYEFSTTSRGPTFLTAASLPASPRRPHLKLVGDAELVVRDGALAIRLATRHGRFTLRYWDPLENWALALSLVGTCGLLALGLVARRRRAGCMQLSTGALRASAVATPEV